MELPDFTGHEELNKLRVLMGADLINVSDSFWEPAEIVEIIRKLSTPEGIEVPFSEITVCNDGTFEYKGQKILVYIRDQYIQFRDKGYKYHICQCKTISEFLENKRFDRYVASQNIDGKFKVKLVDRYTHNVIEDNITEELRICKNCLLILGYKGYSSYSDWKSIQIYNEFNIQEFFSLYKSTQHTVIPKYEDINAPVNKYTPDWDYVSKLFREKNNWTCSNCKINFSNKKHFLDVHHKNGNRTDNSESNLQCLCKDCHSKMPGHEHMKVY